MPDTDPAIEPALHLPKELTFGRPKGEQLQEILEG